MATAAKKVVKMKPTKGMIPAGYADGGKIKPFMNKESMKEEVAEAKAVKSGKLSVGQYVKGEKSEGESVKGAAKTARAIKSGKMTPAAYGKKG